MYSTSIVDNVMVHWFLHFHKMTPMPTNKMYYVVDRWSFASPTQSGSQKLYKSISLPPRHNLKSKVPFKYLMICGKPPFDMNWLTILNANAISTLMSTITYMRDPILVVYGTPSISLRTFPNFSFESFKKLKFTLNEVPTGLHFSMLKCFKTSLM